jgi:hypothetical protein
MCQAMANSKAQAAKDNASSPHISLVKPSFNIISLQGNIAFKSGDYPTAIGHYTTAILANKNDVTYPLNRAAAYLKLGKYVYVIPFDVSSSLSLSLCVCVCVFGWFWGFYIGMKMRRGIALEF